MKNLFQRNQKTTTTTMTTTITTTMTTMSTMTTTTTPTASPTEELQEQEAEEVQKVQSQRRQQPEVQKKSKKGNSTKSYQVSFPIPVGWYKNLLSDTSIRVLKNNVICDLTESVVIIPFHGPGLKFHAIDSPLF